MQRLCGFGHFQKANSLFHACWSAHAGRVSQDHCRVDFKVSDVNRQGFCLGICWQKCFIRNENNTCQ